MVFKCSPAYRLSQGLVTAERFKFTGREEWTHSGRRGQRSEAWVESGQRLGTWSSGWSTGRNNERCKLDFMCLEFNRVVLKVLIEQV